jgi:hypothetical protein
MIRDWVSNSPSSKLRVFAALGSLLLLAGIAAPMNLSNAATVVSDTWIDDSDSDPASPTYSENGVDADADGDIESAWFQGGDGTLNPVAGDGPGPLRGEFSSPTGGSSASWTTYFTPEGSEVNLANAGDTLKVTWVFTPTGVNESNSSQNFRIALVDSPSAARLESDGAPGSAAYTGYGIFANMGQTLGNSNPFRLMERADDSGALLSSSGEWTGLGTTGAAEDNEGYDSGTEYTFMMTIMRTAAGELQVDTSMTGGTLDNDGTAEVSFLDTTPNNGSFKFDTFSLRPSGASTTAAAFDTRLFRVEFTVVPEPTSLLLFGFGAVAITMPVRHRK